MGKAWAYGHQDPWRLPEAADLRGGWAFFQCPLVTGAVLVACFLAVTKSTTKAV